MSITKNLRSKPICTQTSLLRINFQKEKQKLKTPRIIAKMMISILMMLILTTVLRSQFIILQGLSFTLIRTSKDLLKWILTRFHTKSQKDGKRMSRWLAGMISLIFNFLGIMQNHLLELRWKMI